MKEKYSRQKEEKSLFLFFILLITKKRKVKINIFSDYIFFVIPTIFHSICFNIKSIAMKKLANPISLLVP